MISACGKSASARLPGMRERSRNVLQRKAKISEGSFMTQNVMQEGMVTMTTVLSGIRENGLKHCSSLGGL
jgi:hypothetical protein